MPTHRAFLACLFFCGTLAASTHAAEATPFPPEPAPSAPPSDTMPDGLARLRISVASDEDTPDHGVRLGRVIACSATACHQAPTPAQLTLRNTADGQATPIVEMVVPRREIESVHFEEVVGGKVVAGKIDVRMHGFFDGYAHAAEVFVVLRKQAEPTRIAYVPSEADATYYSPTLGFATLYYNPKFAVELASLAFDTGLSIPAGSTAESKIFLISLQDVAKAFPRLEIFPKIALLQPWTVHLTEIMKPWKQPGYAGEPPIVPHEFKSKAVRPFTETGVLAKYSERLGRTGLHNFNPRDLPAPLASSATGLSECLDVLSRHPLAQDMTLPAGVDYIASCEEIPPYIHIATAKMNDPRQMLQVRYQTSTRRIDEMVAFDLYPITEFARNSAIAINGFTWSGDSGRGPGGGVANGFLAAGGLHWADNRQGGGHSKSVPGKSGGAKYALRWNFSGDFKWEGQSDALLLDLGAYANHVSSSTSIVKNGLCASDSLTDRWSAMGTTPDGRAVFVSSTTNGTTNAAELCPIFKNFGVDNAIRLDGGSATGMVAGGDLLNPLGYLDQAWYLGSLRRIAYAVTVR